MASSSASPECGQQSPTCLAASAIARKYQRIQGRPSPLSDHVRRRLLSKLTNSTSSNLQPEQPAEPANRGRSVAIVQNNNILWVITRIKLNSCGG